jgi:diguanylate cyclase (GGDEF)-like protein
MQLARFRSFCEELANEPTIIARARVLVYRRIDERWFASTGERVDDAPLLRDLEVAMSSGSYGRARHSNRACFPLMMLDCVIAATFASPPRKTTQLRFSQLLETAYQHANHAFNAAHDALTGLLNRQAFEEIIHRVLGQLKSVSPAVSSAPEAIPTTSTVSVFELDLDNFKQINDTYGHLYGDRCLQCLARRIENSANEMERRFADRCKVWPARIGGEEFAVLVSGALSTSEVDEIAEDLRQSIAVVPLPSDIEWAQFTASGGNTVLTLPPINERRVTVSVGVASAVSAGDVRDLAQTATLLRAQADTALYRAKVGGRNTVRRFADILMKHGQVLEHHRDTQIVAIDIGRQVNATIGQEFLVFHPDFTGDKPFVHSDGRTQKRLGGYPRYSCGRIVVLDVQQEVSFCRIVERDLEGLFPPGSALELVPVGAIAHFISPEALHGGRGGPNLTPVEVLATSIEQAAADDRGITVVVFALREVDKLVDARGTFFVNQSLADLYATLLELLPGVPTVSQVQPTQFAVVVRQAKVEADELIGRILNTAERKCSHLARFRAGAYARPDSETTSKITGDASELRMVNALSYARYAVSTPDVSSPALEWFSAVTASSIMAAWRRQQRPKEGLADYAKLRELGVRFSYLENQAALCAVEVRPPQKEIALEAIKRAIELSQDDPILRANLGYVEFWCGSRTEAHQAFAAIPKGVELAPVYRGPAALAMYAQYQVDSASVDRGELHAALRRALEVPPAALSVGLRTEIESVVSGLS